jgi:L-serine dehydratase
MENELSYGKTKEEVVEGLEKIWRVMNDTIDRGMRSTEAILPGGLGVCTN